MIPILYALKTILISSSFYGYYWIFLRNKSFHLFNRIYLLLIPILALLLPCIAIPVAWFNQPSDDKMGSQLWKVVGANLSENDPQQFHSQSNFSLLPRNLLLAGYLLVMFVLLMSLLRSYFHIIGISRKYQAIRMEGNILFFNTHEKGTPFSFFNRIFWNDKIDLTSENGINILKHEYYHVHQRHSFDLLYMEILAGICWFNPCFFTIKKELKAIHEFLADEYVISSTDRFAYAELLVTNACNNKHTPIGHPFFYNHIKRRIKMITKSKNSTGIVRRLMVLPVLAILVCAFTLKSARRNQVAEKELTVVIDAGHGGSDAGARSANGIAEKDLALSLAKKIQQISGDYHVHVVMTREKDELAGNLSDIRESLKFRADMAAKAKADLFVSIHINADESDPSKSGFEMYVPRSNSAFFEKSTDLGSMISDAIKTHYPVSYALRQENRGVYILDHCTVPSILIECGFITNRADLDYISKEKNQLEIARDLLEGMTKYGLSISKR